MLFGSAVAAVLFVVENSARLQARLCNLLQFFVQSLSLQQARRSGYQLSDKLDVKLKM